MMQGDACYLAIKILNNAGNPVTPEDISNLEVTIRDARKTYQNQELSYQDGLWFFPLTQDRSFGLWPGAAKAQVRVLWRNGVVEGKPILGLTVQESISKEVL